MYLGYLEEGDGVQGVIMSEVINLGSLVYLGYLERGMGDRDLYQRMGFRGGTWGSGRGDRDSY